MGLFKQLSQVLGTAESLTLSIRKEKEGDQNLVVLIQPVLKSMEAASDEVHQIRAALAMPIRVTETAEVLDTEFLDLLAKWNATRSSLASEDCFARFNESANAAKVAAKKASTDKPKARAAAPKQGEKSATAEATSTVAAPTAPSKQPEPAPAENPDSLF